MPNRLAKEQSPYLLQHSQNPVDWYPWGEEALEKARQEDKPLLVSIGYSACHWCHVMERESFEDHDIAEIMNHYFVNVKIDREERPDLDHIYMDALQSMTGSGGWPLNIFLTPQGKPFYGGTYFPPVRAHQRPSWREVLLAMHEAYTQKRSEIESQSEYLVSHLLKINKYGSGSAGMQEAGELFSAANLDRVTDHIMKQADPVYGGFGHAPKFPQTFTIQYLLRDYYYTRNEASLQQACLSLDKMIQGGIYDQLGGGFARYSTDERWLVPHFEKMLYDNALLVCVLSEAYQLTERPLYRQTVMDTLEFLEREMLSPEGGFYSALDADSEGEEGRFYVWEKSEIEAVLKDDAPVFCAFYGITERGNWEGKNILHWEIPLAAFAEQRDMEAQLLAGRLESCRKRLLAYRNQRVRPMLDDKQLLGWNALAVSAYCQAYAALGQEQYLQRAVRTMEFLEDTFRGTGIARLHHTSKGGHAKIPAFLDDYAGMIVALIRLQEVTGDAKYLLKAKELTEWVILHFSVEESGFFYYTHEGQEDIIIRKIETYDGALPSGNAAMNFNLLYLSVVFDRPDWKERATKNLQALSEMVIEYPGSFGIWATQFQALTYGINEVAIVGKDPGAIRSAFLRKFIPWRVLQSANTPDNQFPLLLGKPCLEQSRIFLCRDYSCQTPVTELSDLFPLLETTHTH